ncbi:uncharacterized protein [Epargyreus clarus]|uniref:uncharacterized protein n=1 Tax=Epargyreus clarus TaxID=520877 RepID=UPI003C2F3E3F
MWLPSPTICNCCPFCLPFFVSGAHCSAGGPGLGTTVGRCGHGLTCERETLRCIRMTSKCHSAQDDYDRRHNNGEVGALEQRPYCDGKGRYAAFDCVPAQSCFCQSEEGERIFGEVVFASSTQNMPCGCSRFHDNIRKSLSPGVPFPVVGPRCTIEGNFNPVQCVNRTCHCVNRITGVARPGGIRIDLDKKPITDLPCYDPTVDLFPEQSRGKPPYNYTTPCLEAMREKIEFIQQSEREGFIMDFFNEVEECWPDGTYGRVMETRNDTKVCIDQRRTRIGDYVAVRNTPEYDTMDCKCAVTSQMLGVSHEKPVCCRNGNFRKIQCRRGQCRCVDSNGKQVGRESEDVTKLACHSDDWQDC